MKKKVAILIPSLNKGGAEKQAVLLAESLCGEFDVRFYILFEYAGIERELLDLYKGNRDDIVSMRCSKLNAPFRLYRQFRRFKPDVLFCYLTYPDFVGPLVGRIAGIPVIYQGLRNAELPKAKMILERIGNMFSTGTVVNNYVGGEIFRSKGLRGVTVIPNCYPDPKQSFDRQPKDSVTVITVGRFVEQKDYPTAIASVSYAMKENPAIRFKIIGHGNLEPEVRRLVEESGIGDRTEILINPPGILNHLMDADIYLSTSLFEGTSNSIMEAMDCSLPVVATGVGDNEYLVKDGVNGFITGIKDIAAISGCIVKLADSPQMRRRMGKEGNRLLREQYSVEKFRENYKRLI